MIKSFLNLCLAFLTAGAFYGGQAAEGTVVRTEAIPTQQSLSGSYSTVVTSYDWGSAVSGAILSLEDEVAHVSPEMFSVIEEKQLVDTIKNDAITRQIRPISNVFLCDSSGTPTSTPSNYVYLQLEVSPKLGSSLCYFPDQQHYYWADPYRLIIDLNQGQIISGVNNTYSSLAISRDATGRSLPQARNFQTAYFTGLEHMFSFASYSPPKDNAQHPLIIWLHGLGEGGKNIDLPLLGTNVAAFTEDSFQTLMNGAYVLVPQCPTMWLDNGFGSPTTTGQSLYTKDLMQLIRFFVSSHPGIDPQRIYVGGCSNGGYMTLSLLLEDPDYFAAAFPVCEAYDNSWLSDEDIQILKDIPIWFTHSELDQICPPQNSTFPTVERLIRAGGQNIHLSRLSAICDATGQYKNEDGSPHQYDPHFAWIPVLNNECTAPTTNLSLFQWLSQQKLNQ